MLKPSLKYYLIPKPINLSIISIKNISENPRLNYSSINSSFLSIGYLSSPNIKVFSRIQLVIKKLKYWFCINP